MATAQVVFNLDEIRVEVTATNISGNICGVDIVLSGLLLEALSHDFTTNVADVSIVLPKILARSYVSYIVKNVDRTYAFNVRNHSVTPYLGYNFNSFCKFGDIYLGAGSGKIFQLEGNDDNASSIEILLHINAGDMTINKLKRVDSILLNFLSNGMYEVGIALDDKDDNWYQFKDSAWRLHPYRRKVGKGKGRNVIIKIRNKSGSRIEIDKLDALVETLTRII